MRNRLILSGLAATGALETGSIVFSRLLTSDGHVPFCTSETCLSVLSSPISTLPVVNVPLANFGFAAYLTITILSMISLIRPGDRADRAAPSTTTAHPLDPMLLFLTTSSVTVSACLLALMTFVLHAPCNLCFLSAGISAAMAGVTWNPSFIPDTTSARVTKAGAVLTSLAAASFLYYTASLSLPKEAAYALPDPAPVNQAVMIVAQEERGAEPADGESPPAVTTSSSQRAMALASQLRLLDAKMYGTFWCSHCFNQKQALGEEAMRALTYIECDKAGAGSQHQLCMDRKVKLSCMKTVLRPPFPYIYIMIVISCLVRGWGDETALRIH